MKDTLIALALVSISTIFFIPKENSYQDKCMVVLPEPKTTQELIEKTTLYKDFDSLEKKADSLHRELKYTP